MTAYVYRLSVHSASPLSVVSDLSPASMVTVRGPCRLRTVDKMVKLLAYVVDADGSLSALR